eukprot:CAMPEP_0202702894 /NCGR_PEP_ID=MMETSP1385-20130828/15818_1 /ASSEMBLY_ACC=CAM_ASM_000861 /TAXON_ID=933848 /ORGANISM="Elphidium margaritaceum" /LENGTH=476 /DNA_ID=CAMNT_0049360641 /DNA_START=16 /DNA_END=1446 /DNA_ORIENTATION=-
MTYSYYDYLESYYEDYYEYYYWPMYYNHTNMTYYNGTYPPSPWEQPYPMDVFNPIFWGISLLCAVLSVVLLAFISYQIYERHAAGKLRSSKTTVVLIVSCLLLHTGFCILDPIAYSRWYVDYQGSETTDSVDIAWDVFWVLSKISLYFVFGNRYYNIFKAATTMDAEGKRKKLVMFGLFLFAIALQIVLITIYILFYYLYEDSETIDAKQFYLKACWSFLAVDVCLIAVISYLLNRSILKLVVFERAVNKMAIVTSKVDAPSHLAHGGDTNDHSRNSKMEMSSVQYTSHQSSPQPTHSADDRATTVSDAAANGDTAMSTDKGVNTLSPHGSVSPKIKPQKKKTAADIGSYDEKGKFKLLHTTTRIALTCVISIVSSLVYQLVWNIAEELEDYDVLWFTYTWSIDAVINMVCVYLSMGIANDQYKMVCVDLCHCHQCCLRVVMRAVSVSTEKKIRKIAAKQEAKELSLRSNTVTTKE